MKILKFKDINENKIYVENLQYQKILKKINMQLLTKETITNNILILIDFIENETTEIKKFFTNGNFNYIIFNLPYGKELSIFYNNKEYGVLQAYNDLFNIEFDKYIVVE